MSTPYLGEVKIISFNFAPKGWAFCNGQLMPINQNQALFAILGTTYGGDGQTTFALPNLQARSPIHFGNGFNQGQAGGELAHTLVMSEMPAHTHFPIASSNVADLNTPVGNFWGKGAQVIYSPTGGSLMKPNAASPVGGSQPHDNQSPYLVLNFIIALSGIFPSRN